jgi:tetratricopeptide (TPR) repeat protein
VHNCVCTMPTIEDITEEVATGADCGDTSAAAHTYDQYAKWDKLDVGEEEADGGGPKGESAAHDDDNSDDLGPLARALRAEKGDSFVDYTKRRQQPEPQPQPQPEVDPDFCASTSFQGARSGFAFQTGQQGTGYYRGRAPPTPGAGAEAAAGAALVPPRRTKANALVKKKDFRAALDIYEAILVDDDDDDDGSAGRGSLPDEERVTILSNCALCHLKLGQYEQAARVASRVLEVDPDHTKALYRRGQARLAMGGATHARAARSDFERALELAPTNLAGAIEAALARCAVGGAATTGGGATATAAVAAAAATSAPRSAPTRGADGGGGGGGGLLSAGWSVAGCRRSAWRWARGCRAYLVHQVLPQALAITAWMVCVTAYFWLTREVVSLGRPPPPTADGDGTMSSYGAGFELLASVGKVDAPATSLGLVPTPRGHCVVATTRNMLQVWVYESTTAGVELSDEDSFHLELSDDGPTITSAQVYVWNSKKPDGWGVISVRNPSHAVARTMF